MNLEHAIVAHLRRCFNPHLALPSIGLKRLASAHHASFQKQPLGENASNEKTTGNLRDQ